MSEFNAGSYGIFSDAVATAETVNEKVSSSQEALSGFKSELGNDAVFMGPICESCLEGFANVDTKMTDLTKKFSEISKYLTSASDNYKKGDSTAASDLLSSIGGSGNTQASSLFELGNKANNGDKEAQQQWLDQMAKLVTPICKKYDFPVSVLLAQIIQESGWVKSGSWLNDNNNILNVNYEMFGSGDYVRSIDGNVDNSVPIPKWAEYKTWASGSVSGGANFEAPRDDEAMRSYNNVEDCVEDYLGLMVGYRPFLKGSDVDTAIDGIQHYAEDARYATKLHNAINNHNLTKYDV